MDYNILIQVTTIAISLLALITSVYIGIKQVKISKVQNDMQNKVELYLLSQPITISHAYQNTPDILRPALYIRNIGSAVVYLERYIFNGREYPLGKEILPPVSAYDGYRYIFLPTDGTDHVSFEIFFLDWQNNPWKTSGYADFINYVWEVIYEPCVRIKK